MTYMLLQGAFCIGRSMVPAFSLSLPSGNSTCRTENAQACPEKPSLGQTGGGGLLVESGHPAGMYPGWCPVRDESMAV